MIKFSKRTKYAVQCLIHLQAYRDRCVIAAQQISQTQNIPEKFLSSILSTMKKNGWVKSKQGPSGGYFLAENAEQKSLKEIIEALEIKELDTESETKNKEAKISEAEILNALGEIDTIITKASRFYHHRWNLRFVILNDSTTKIKCIRYNSNYIDYFIYRIIRGNEEGYSEGVAPLDKMCFIIK